MGKINLDSRYSFLEKNIKNEIPSKFWSSSIEQVFYITLEDKGDSINMHSFISLVCKIKVSGIYILPSDLLSSAFQIKKNLLSFCKFFIVVS